VGAVETVVLNKADGDAITKFKEEPNDDPALRFASSFGFSIYAIRCYYSQFEGLGER
jgi:hypothetical protein